MKRTHKKGFTVVELVIVIAIIAVLAAILIPTFAGVINNARRSADARALSEMNKALSLAAAEDQPDSIGEAIDALLESGIDMDHYKPLVKGMEFYWVKSINRVVYVDKDKAIKLPADYADTEYTAGDWWSLSGKVAEDTSWKKNVDAGNASISSGAQLVALMNAYNDGDAKAKTVTKITLTEDVDLMGAAINFKEVAKSTAIEIDGNGKTIYGVRNGAYAKLGYNKAGNASAYGYSALFGVVRGTITVKNLTIDGATIDASRIAEDDTQPGHGGVIVGSLYGTARIENVTIKNSSVNVEKKAGALVGFIQGGNLTLAGEINVTDTAVAAGREAAALIGYTQKAITVEAGATINATVTVSHDTSYGYTLNENGNAVADFEDAAKAGITSHHYWDAIGKSSATAVGADLT